MTKDAESVILVRLGKRGVEYDVVDLTNVMAIRFAGAFGRLDASFYGEHLLLRTLMPMVVQPRATNTVLIGQKVQDD